MEGERKSACIRSPAVLCILNMGWGGISGVALATNPKSARCSDPSTAAHISPSSSSFLPGHHPVDLELRPQTGLLRRAGMRLRTGIMSKAPHSIPEQERWPVNTGAQ